MFNLHKNKNASNNWLNNQNYHYYHNQNQHTQKRNNYNSDKYKPDIKKNKSKDIKKDNSLSIEKQLKFEKLRLSQKEFSNNLFSKLRRHHPDSSGCPSCNKG